MMPKELADLGFGSADDLEASLTYQGLVIIAATLAEADYEMTFRPVKQNLPDSPSTELKFQKIIFEPSQEALLKLNRIDDSKPLRQVNYESSPPNDWKDFCKYFSFLLYILFKENESNTIAEKITHRVFDFALLNSPENDPMNSRLRPLTDTSWEYSEHYSKYKACTAKYAAQIKEVQVRMESFPKNYLPPEGTENVNAELLLWIQSPDISNNTDLRISAYNNDFNLNDETVDALLASPKFHVIRRLTLSQIYLSRQSLEKILTLPNLIYLEISGGSYSDWAGPNYISPTLNAEDIEFLRMHQQTNRKLQIFLYNQEEGGGSIIGAY